MVEWQIVRLPKTDSPETILSTFQAEDVRFENRGQHNAAVGYNGQDVVAIIPLWPDRYIRRASFNGNQQGENQ